MQSRGQGAPGAAATVRLFSDVMLRQLCVFGYQLLCFKDLQRPPTLRSAGTCNSFLPADEAPYVLRHKGRTDVEFFEEAARADGLPHNRRCGMSLCQIEQVLAQDDGGVPGPRCELCGSHSLDVACVCVEYGRCLGCQRDHTPIGRILSLSEVLQSLRPLREAFF